MYRWDKLNSLTVHVLAFHEPQKQGAWLGCSELAIVTTSQSQEATLDLNF